MPADFYSTFVQKIEAATPESLQALAKELLQPDNLAIIVVGKAAEIKPQLEKIGKVIVFDDNLKEIPISPK
ncbi:hypothetical protein Q0P93_14790, partial [Staphylococcus aureus]|nr:hypothetical protein [Staphylococcus aureus]